MARIRVEVWANLREGLKEESEVTGLEASQIINLLLAKYLRNEKRGSILSSFSSNTNSDLSNASTNGHSQNSQQQKIELVPTIPELVDPEEDEDLF